MKKRTLLFASCLASSLMVLFLVSVAMAGTIGNPTLTAAKGSFQLSAGVDLAERDMDVEDEEYEWEGTSFFIRGTYGISDTVNIHAKLGVCETDDSNGDNEIFYGIGLKGNVYEKDNVKIGFVAQVSRFTAEDDEDWPPFSAEIELDWWEYDIGLGASFYGAGNFVPYAGFLFSKVDGEWDFSVATLDVDDDFDEEDSFGAFLGADYFFSPEFSISGEARLVNENSFSLTLNYSF